MTICVSLSLPNRPTHDHSFTYAVELEHRSPSDKITDSTGTLSVPREVLNGGSHTSLPPSLDEEVENLISHVKKSHHLSLEDGTIQWCPNHLVKNPTWTPLDNEEELIRHVLDAARDAVTCAPEGKKPSSLCLKIKKVVTMSESEFKNMVAARRKKMIEDEFLKRIKAAMTPLNNDNFMYVNFKGLFSDDVGYARAVWDCLFEVMTRGFVDSDKEDLGPVFDRAREWELKERVLTRVESSEEEEEECCSICLVGDGGRYKLPCGHTYHLECILKWINSKRHCPICRFEL